MQTRIAKWGNSLAVRVPREIAEAAKLTEGTAVELAVENNAVVIRPAGPRYQLADLLVGMTPKAMHEAFDWGPDVGREDVS
ncbi:MAG: AbrB/MazE/SpoVT family DNA-binding domain-containing protein [Proteobacteria bacterium]|nr:AbrB/MazE/SpoVT family DNA-binding domain-containing protein [Pseudomonadota bacterium]